MGSWRFGENRCGTLGLSGVESPLDFLQAVCLEAKVLCQADTGNSKETFVDQMVMG